MCLRKLDLVSKLESVHVQPLQKAIPFLPVEDAPWRSYSVSFPQMICFYGILSALIVFNFGWGWVLLSALQTLVSSFSSVMIVISQ
jgi:hypothetical protein